MTDTPRLKAKGVLLQLPDGQEVRIRFGYDELEKIEEKYGSIQEYGDQLEPTKPMYTAVLFGLVVGTGIPKEQLSSILEPQDLKAHSEVLTQALVQAFPLELQELAERQGLVGTDESPGTITTTSQPSVTDAAMMTSGG